MKAHILVVDDEEVTLLTLKRILESQGFEVTVASNGLEALKIFKAQPFDLVITDIRLPELDGLDMLKRVKSIEPDVEVIILSVVKDVNTAIEALKGEQGAFDYLIKPVDDIDQLISTVEKALERRRLRVENRLYLQKLEAANLELSTLAEVSRTVGSSLELDEVLKRLVKVTAEAMEARICTIRLIEKDHLTIGAAVGYRDESARMHPIPIDEAIAQVTRDLKPWIIPDLYHDPIVPQRRVERARREGVRSFLAVPIVYRDRAIGILSIYREDVHHFTPGEVGFLSTIANHAAVAVENARLYEEERQRVKELDALGVIATTVSGTLDLDELLQNVLDKVLEVMGVGRGGIHLVDERSNELRLRVYRDISPDWEEILDGIKLGTGIAGKVASSGGPCLFDDLVANRDLPPAVRMLIERDNIRAHMAVPLRSKDKILGVLSISAHQKGIFTPEDLRLLTAIGNQIGVAIENAWLYNRTEEQLTTTEQINRELRSLQETTNIILSSLDLMEVLNLIAQQVVEGLGYRWALVSDLDEKTRTLEVKGVAGDPYLIRLGERLAGRKGIGFSITLDQTENLGVRSALADQITTTHDLYAVFRPMVSREAAEAFQKSLRLKTMINVPLITRGRLVGNMIVGSAKEEITPAEIASLQAFANQAAVAIANAKLYAEVRGFSRTLEEQVEEKTRELREAKDFYHRLIESMDLGLAVIGADLRFQFINQVYKEIYKLGNGVVGRRCYEVIHRRQEPCSECPVLRAIKEERTSEGVIEYQGRIIEVSCLPLRSSTARPAVMEICRDITERRRMEFQLIQSQKLAGLGQLAAGIAHELRNPLGIINTSLYFIKEVLEPKDPDIEKHLKIIESEINRTRNIIENLLEFSRRSERDVEEVDLNLVLEKTLALLDKELRVNDIALHLNQSDLPPLKLNLDEMKQAFLNIILNAAQAMPQGGDLTITTCLVPPSDGHPPYVEISFEDTGHGIPESVLEEVFNPFFSTKGMGEGTGLGLSITHSIVKHYGGDISIESKEGRGTKITIRLPVKRPEAM